MRFDIMSLLLWCNENFTFEIFLPKYITKSNHEKLSDIQSEKPSIEQLAAFFQNASVMRDCMTLKRPLIPYFLLL